MGRKSATSLAPGFRFHPTDEELVRYYLKRKVCNKPFRFDAISEIDIYKSEPWDLPGKSKLKSRDLEWYFFSVLDKKYGNGSRTNRATEKGYWKTTGKDRPIGNSIRTVGMKKTLVYHCGRAPRGERTNWVMHEYRLVDEELEKAGVVQDAFVLCRIFQKSGSGPKNGEQYGAPFVEEDWDDNDEELIVVPGEEAVNEVPALDDAYVEATDIDQNIDLDIPSENALHPLNFYYGDSSNYVKDSRDFIQNDEKPFIGMGENNLGPELPNDQKIFDLPAQYETDAKSVEDEYLVEQSNDMNPEDDANYLLDVPYLDATDSPLFDDGLFLEANDLSDPVEADGVAGSDMLDEYLAYLDAEGDISQYLTFDSSNMMGIENPVDGQASLSHQLVNGHTEEVSTASQHNLKAHSSDGASSSMPNPKAEEFESDSQYPFIKKASHMLGSFPAPPAFASEFPTKDAILRLNSAAQSSGSVHVTAGMIQIQNLTLSGNGVNWSFAKDGDVNFIFSFGFPQYDVNSTSLEPMASLLSGKMSSALSRGWVYLIFFWALVLSASYKIGTYIYTR